MRRRGPSLNSCRPSRRRPSTDGATRCERTLRCQRCFQPIGASDPALPLRLRHVESHKQHPKRRRDNGRSRLQQFRMSQHCPRLRRAPRTIDDGMAIARWPHRHDRPVSRARPEPIAPERQEERQERIRHVNATQCGFGGGMMKRSALVFALLVLSVSAAFAQSSGNFDADVNPTVCTLNASSGNVSTLLITPSAITGLFTSTKLSTTINTATADIGVKVCVQVAGGHVLPNPTPTAPDTSCVVYDQRFQQISNTLFTNVATCAAGNAGAVCTSDADCTAGTICGPPDLTGTQMCTCGFDLTLSTLSAHSFNFIAQVPGDNLPHHVRATWRLTGVNQTVGASSVAACVGPADVTVTQTKIFKNSGSSLAF